MPGFILHLTAAQMLLKHLPSHPDFPYPISSVNDFLIGNLLPDATQQKESSHFRDPLYREKMMVFPDLTRFTAKYRSLLPDSSALGYYYHLYIDLYLTFKHDGISADLFSCGKYNNIIEYEILRGERYLSPVTDCSSLRRV